MILGGEDAIVALFGALVGAAELAARYKDEPAAAIRTLPGIIYLLVNAMASVGMLFVLKTFNIDFGLAAKGDSQLQLVTTQILAAGFSAMALLRSSVFSFDKAVAALPAYCLGLMQNLSQPDRESLAREIESISKLKAVNAIKSRLLGLAIVNVMGTKVLMSAIESLGDNVREVA